LFAVAAATGAGCLKHFPPLQAQFSAEQIASPVVRQQLDQYWQQFSRTELSGRDGVKFCLYSRTTLPAWRKPVAALLVVPGRIEAAHKYAEVVQDALCSGYQVFVLDHRGQGLAQRPAPNPQLGDIADFQLYVDDLTLAISHIRSKTDLPMLALAHSMGGAILYRYLQTTALPLLDAAVFSAPMFGIPTGPLPALAALLASLMHRINKAVSTRGWFVTGQTQYQPQPFAGNDLTNCPQRYQWFRDLYQQYPAYQLGGVSWAWLDAALRACRQIRQEQAPQLPMLVLQAGADTVVDNNAHTILANEHGVDLKTISAARHELLAGTDAERLQVYTLINQWLRQHGAKGPDE
jgi:lysophospholipase